jgi:transcriptional regulator GlxA family with amidase domain
VATRRYTELRGDIDTLIVAGGSGARENATPELVRWLARNAPRARRYGSVCTGAYLLGAAGLLAGRSVTTHWAWAKQLASLYPEAHVDPEPIWLRDERLYSSAGVTAGIDLCLSLVSNDLGPEVALTIARYLVLYLHRPGGQGQFSVPLSAQQTEAPRLAALVPFMLANLRGDLSVPRLAQKAGMSPRNFARAFEREFSRGPGAYVRELRLEAARRSLESSERSLDEVAEACGFNSAEVMGRAFRERLGVTPGGYRERFKRGRRARAPRRSTAA